MLKSDVADDMLEDERREGLSVEATETMISVTPLEYLIGCAPMQNLPSVFKNLA